MKEPLSCTLARKLLSELYDELLFYSAHALREMKNRRLTELDVVNVIRAGRIHEPAEKSEDGWTYRVHTDRICVVVAFVGLAGSEERGVVVVTAWRKR